MNIKYFQWKSTKHEKIPKPNRGEIFSRSKKFQVGPKKKSGNLKATTKKFQDPVGKNGKELDR